MPFFLLFVWTVISSIIFCQTSFAQENLKMIQSTGRAAILEDISKDEARNLALEDALYYAALKGGAQIDGFSHVNSETALEDEFLGRPISKILDYNIAFLNGEKNNTNFEKYLRKLNPALRIFRAKYTPKNIKDFKLNDNFLMFSGIGNPIEFEKPLKKFRFKIKKKIIFPDHYNYKN